MIPVTKPFLPAIETYQDLIATIWETNWLTNSGPLLQRLEKDVASFLKLDDVSFVGNGTIAIQLALRALNVTGHILTTPFSYVATTSAPVWEGCEVGFVDIDPDTLNIDATKIEAALRPDTQALVVTHVFGNPVDVEMIDGLAKKHGFKVIYDAAHCFGVDFKGKSIFEYGDVSTLSTHATKIFHTVEGGFLWSRDQDVRDRVAYLKNFGHDGPEKFHGVGINGKNSEFHSAMGLAMLPEMPAILARRAAQYALYSEGLKSNAALRLQQIHPDAKHNSSYFPVVFADEAALLKVIAKLKTADIFPRRYFYPSLNKLDYVNGPDMPVSEHVSKSIICLPLYHTLGDENILKICEIINGEVG